MRKVKVHVDLRRCLKWSVCYVWGGPLPITVVEWNVVGGKVQGEVESLSFSFCYRY
jgi:hypothetical protein